LWGVPGRVRLSVLEEGIDILMEYRVIIAFNQSAQYLGAKRQSAKHRFNLV